MVTMLRRLGWSMMTGALSLTVAWSAHAEGPFFTRLGSLGHPAGGFSSASGISADGSTVVGATSSPQADPYMAFRWQAGTMTGLGDLPGSVVFSVGYGVSADGTVVVGTGTSASGQQAFRWTGGVMTGLGGLPGASGSTATGVSGDGTVVVGESYVLNVSGEAFRWESGVMTGLGVLPGGNLRSTAWAASADGSVVVGVSSSANGTSEAFRWEGGVMTGLGALPSTVFSSLALGVSADGSVVVGYSNSAHGVEAFRWEAGVMRGLGFPAGKLESVAHAVSDDGSVVVGEATAQPDYNDGDAVIWTSGGARSVKDLLVNNLGVNLSGWQLLGAEDVSADGSTIVGTGINPAGQTEGWIAVLPACSDNRDNDGDGLVDYPADTGCTSAADSSEKPECSDGLDNDGDGLIDYPADPGCLNDTPFAQESPACQDGIDNDGDGNIDFDGGAAANHGIALGPVDVQCTRFYQTAETTPPPVCGLGVELAAVVPLLLGLREMRRRRIA